MKKALLDANVWKMQQVLRGEEGEKDAVTIDKTIAAEMGVDTAAPRYCVADANVYDDVEMFVAYDHTTEGSASVFSGLDKCHLRGSSPMLRHILGHPVHEAAVLDGRQLSLASVSSKASALERIVDDMRGNEAGFLWLFQTRDADLSDLYNAVFFKSRIAAFLNGSPGALTAWNLHRIVLSPLMGFLTPVMYVIVPYLVMRWHYGIVVPLTLYLRLVWKSLMMGASSFTGGAGGSVVRWVSLLFTIVFYFQGMFNTIEVSKTLSKVSRVLRVRVSAAGKFMEKALEAIELASWHTASGANVWVPNIPDFPETRPCLRDCDADPWLGLGRPLFWYRRFQTTSHRHSVKVVAQYAYVLDAVLSIVRLRKEHDLCIPKFLHQGPSVTVEFHDMCHPSLATRSHVVRNDVVLGCHQVEGSPRSAILTGPNACGKSTVLKALLLNVLLAQSIGVCFAREATLTPVHKLNSQIRLPDDKERASLFQTECIRCADMIASVERDPNERHLIVIDELFSSTNPIEGISAGYAIAKRLGSSANCSCVISTHFVYLAKLAKDYPHWFKNVRMTADVSPDGSIIHYPFKIASGVSRQSIALEVMSQRKILPPSVLDDAVRVRDRFLNRVRSTGAG